MKHYSVNLSNIDIAVVVLVVYKYIFPGLATGLVMVMV